MTPKRQTSLMLGVVWACAVVLPVSSADAHGNNPKYGLEDDTLPKKPKPPLSSWLPKQFNFRTVSGRNNALSGISDFNSDADSAQDGSFEIAALPDPAAALRSLLDIGGPSPYDGSQSLDLLAFTPEQASGAPLLPGGTGLAGAVPAPGTLAILGLAAAIAGRRRRRHD